MASGTKSLVADGDGFRIEGTLTWSISGNTVTWTYKFTSFEYCGWSSSYNRYIFYGRPNTNVTLNVGGSSVSSGNVFSGYPYGTAASGAGAIAIKSNQTLTRTTTLSTSAVRVTVTINSENDPSASASFTLGWNVSYRGNGDDAGSTANQIKAYGTTLTIYGCSWTKTGHAFSHWNTKADGSGTSYATHASYTANAALTLYAIWKATNSTILSVTSAVETLGSISLQMDRKGTTRWHKATYSYNGTTLLISDPFETALATTVPREWFSHCTDSATMDVTLSVVTYTDSTCTTTTGSPVTATITVTADAGIAPTVDTGWAVAAPYNTGAAAAIQNYVKNISRAEVTFDATKVTHSYGATLASFSVTYKGETVSASPYRTGVLTETGVTVICRATDTRGRSASESLTLTVMDYGPPTISRSYIYHCLSDGTQDIGGYFLSVMARIACTSLNGANTVSATVAVAPKGGSYGAETTIVSDTAVILSTYSPDLTWVVRIRATDTMGSTSTYEETIAPRTWAMKFRADGNGVAFGKAAEENLTFEITPDWAVKSRGIINLIYPVGSIYMSVNSTDPGILFGFGTWVPIEDTFLLAAGSTYAAGSTGGEAMHTLSVGEMPQHSHSYDGDSSHIIGLYINGQVGRARITRPTSGNYWAFQSNSSGANDLVWGTSATQNEGSGTAHNNMPPYLTVYVWKRTA